MTSNQPNEPTLTDEIKELEAIEDAFDSADLRRAVEENEGFVTLESIIAVFEINN